jgi:putative membrane protein insertion efficiency factor
MCCRDGVTDLWFWAGLPEVVVRTVAGLVSRRAPSAPSAGGLLARAATLAIREYQRVISSRTPARCRFTPTCSQYGLLAVQRYGLRAGLGMIRDRLRRCAPSVPLGTPDPPPTSSLARASRLVAER